METRAAAPRRLIIAITGATGAVYGVRLLETLRRLGGVETHLLISSAGWLNIQHELQLSKETLHGLADERGHVISANLSDLRPQRLDASGDDGLLVGTRRVSIGIRRRDVVLPRPRQIKLVVENR